MNEFQLFLYLSQEIPARCAVEFIRKECVDEGSVVELLFSFTQKLKWVVEAVQGVRRLRRVSVMKLSRSVEGLLLQVYAESKKLEQLKCSKFAARSACKEPR
jgi:hypothetical protein